MTRIAVPLDVLHALVAMAPRSQRKLAAAIELDQANLSAALRGLRPFSQEPLDRLLEELGLDRRGHLRHDRVHLWILGARVEPLRLALEFLCPDGANFAGVWREGGGRGDIHRFNDAPLVALTDGEVRVIVRSEGIGLWLKPDPLNRETVPSLRYRLVPREKEARMVDIPAPRFRAWEAGEISREEFDSVLGTTRPERKLTPRRR